MRVPPRWRRLALLLMTGLVAALLASSVGGGAGDGSLLLSPPPPLAAARRGGARRNRAGGGGGGGASASASASAPAARLPRVTLLSVDFHTGPIADLKDVARRHPELGVDVLDLSLSQACAHVRPPTCASPRELRVLRSGDTAFSMYLSRETKLRFFDAYRSWPEGAGAAAAARRRAAAAKHEPQRLADEEVELRAARAAAAARPELAAAARRGRLVVNGTLIDAVVCSHPTGACELYMPFDVAIILWATTRFEQGRELDPSRMSGLVANVRAIASPARRAAAGNTLMANNLYDVHYLGYFTGLRAALLPSLCAYPEATYSWTRAAADAEALALAAAPGKGAAAALPPPPPPRFPPRKSRFSRPFIVPVFGYRPGKSPGSMIDFLSRPNELAEARGLPFRFENVLEYFRNPDRYEYAELAAQPAVMHLPYQVRTARTPSTVERCCALLAFPRRTTSPERAHMPATPFLRPFPRLRRRQVSVMSLYEHFRMGLPVLAPSRELLTRWHLAHLFVSERTWRFHRPSIVPRHAESAEPARFDPNDDDSYGAVSHWLGHADYFQ